MDQQEQQRKTLEEQFNYVESNRKVGDWLKKRFAWIILIIASVLFVFKEGLELSASGQDIITLIMNMGLTYLFALYTSISLRRLGKKSGKESGIFTGALKYLADAKSNIKDIMYLLPVFLRHKNEQSLQDVKKLYLEENGLVFNLYKKGYYDTDAGKQDLSDIQKIALKKVEKIKITKLTASDLLSEHSKSGLKHLDPLYLGIDEKTDAKISNIQMLVTKAILPIVTSYFAVQVVFGEGIIWGAIQVSIVLVIGVAHYMEGEDYVITELRNRQINKADLLIEFKNTYDNKRYLYEEQEKVISGEIYTQKDVDSIGLTD